MKAALYGVKAPKAVAKITDDLDELLAETGPARVGELVRAASGNAGRCPGRWWLTWHRSQTVCG